MQPTSKPISSADQGGQPAKAGSLQDRLRATTDMLEALAADKALLAEIPVEERTRLLRAAGEVYCPDPNIRRRLVKGKAEGECRLGWRFDAAAFFVLPLV